MQVSRSIVIFTVTMETLDRCSMTYQTIKLSVDGGVARLELNRPDAANAINLELSIELEDAANAIAADPSVRAVLLTGAGARFCGGGDVTTFAGCAGDELAALLAEIPAHVHPAVETLVNLDAPVVVAVQGSAAGAGLGLVLAADLVIAARSAKFVMAFTAIGLSPDASTSWFLPRVGGQRRALELTLMNRVLSATEAHEWGIVTSVVDDDALFDVAADYATTLAAGPTAAFGRAARLLRGTWDTTLPEQLTEERTQLSASGGTADGREGVAAFVEKRPPRFEGR